MLVKGTINIEDVTILNIYAIDLTSPIPSSKKQVKGHLGPGIIAVGVQYPNLIVIDLPNKNISKET